MARNKPKKRPKSLFGRVWYFLWDDNSVWSWIVNVVLAFVLIKFVVYPFLGLVLSTSHPIVAVVSNSMEHNGGFDDWWAMQGSFYEKQNITKESFLGFNMKNGFNKGDIMVLKGVKPQDLKVGDIIVFQSKRPDPIIHRVIEKRYDSNGYSFITKGDNNIKSIMDDTLDEGNVTEDLVIGKALFRVPLLGYVKILFVDLVDVLR